MSKLPANETAVIELFNAGSNIQEIADRFGVSRQAVSLFLKKRNLDPNAKKIERVNGSDSMSQRLRILARKIFFGHKKIESNGLFSSARIRSAVAEVRKNYDDLLAKRKELAAAFVCALPEREVVEAQCNPSKLIAFFRNVAAMNKKKLRSFFAQPVTDNGWHNAYWYSISYLKYGVQNHRAGNSPRKAIPLPAKIREILASLKLKAGFDKDSER